MPLLLLEEIMTDSEAKILRDIIESGNRSATLSFYSGQRTVKALEKLWQHGLVVLCGTKTEYYVVVKLKHHVMFNDQLSTEETNEWFAKNIK
jgi:hypothetical protein